MATFVGEFNTSHSPYCYAPVERWNEIRARRALSPEVPVDDDETNRQKKQRIEHGFATLRSKLAEAGPDVVVICGNDQLENFRFDNYPSFSVYLGDEFEGRTSGGDLNFGRPDGQRPEAPRQRVQGHPALATALLTGLMQRGFDPAFSMQMPEGRGMCHAIMRPAESLTDYSIPIVPLLLNCYYTPQPTAARCYQFGKALREIIEDYPGDLRVAVVGSGGLWHTPGAKNAYLDEEFDRGLLRCLEKGDVRGMAERFDTYRVPEGDASQEGYLEAGRATTGLPTFGGPQGGTRETCNWIAAAATVDGHASTIVDYVPVYASPLGAAFSYFLDV